MILKNSLILIKGLELSVQRIQKHKFNSGEAEFFSFGCLYFLLETENFDPKSIDLFLNFGSFLKLSCLIYLVFFFEFRTSVDISAIYASSSYFSSVSVINQKLSKNLTDRINFKNASKWLHFTVLSSPRSNFSSSEKRSETF